MVKFLLVGTEGNSCIYQYYPEGREAYGVILLDVITGKAQLLNAAPNDEFKTYGFHAMHRIEDEMAKGVLPEKGTVAWF